MRFTALILTLVAPGTVFAFKPQQDRAPAADSDGKLQPPPADKSTEPPRKKQFTGRRVDLDFKNADIHNVLRLLADAGQVNIVTTDDVKGQITIKMRDVPWDHALDVIARGKKLAYDREGDTIRLRKSTPQ